MSDQPGLTWTASIPLAIADMEGPQAWDVWSKAKADLRTIAAEADVELDAQPFRLHKPTRVAGVLQPLVVPMKDGDVTLPPSYLLTATGTGR